MVILQQMTRPDRWSVWYRSRRIIICILLTDDIATARVKFYQTARNGTKIPYSSEELMSLFRTFIPTFGTMITTGLLFTLDHVFWEILELLVK